MKFELHHGDCLDVLKTLADCSVDAIVTDPPYGLGKEPDPVKVMAAWVSQGYFEVEGSGFMGKKWDAFVPQPIIWKEVFRVLKPGGHLLAFAGTRTQDWMAMSLRFAGFEIRDMIAWVYGSGFPKSMDLSKAIDKRGGNIPWQAEFAEHLRAIKPAGMRATEISSHVANGSKSNFWGHFIDTKCQPLLPTLEQYRKLRELLPIDPAWDQHFLPEAEREVVGKKRTGDPVSWYAESVRGDGVVDITAPATEAAKQWEGWGTALKPALEPITLARKPLIGTVAANVLEHGTGGLNIDGCRVGRDADDVSGWSQTGSKTSENRAMSGGNYARDAKPDAEGRWPANFIHDGSEEVLALGAGSLQNAQPPRIVPTHIVDSMVAAAK
jgi:hypothetical protein